jgi:hypothetical protein
MDIKKKKREVRLGPDKLTYNEILELELSKVKEYLGLLTREEQRLVWAMR